MNNVWSCDKCFPIKLTFSCLSIKKYITNVTFYSKGMQDNKLTHPFHLVGAKNSFSVIEAISLLETMSCIRNFASWPDMWQDTHYPSYNINFQLLQDTSSDIALMAAVCTIFVNPCTLFYTQFDLQQLLMLTDPIPTQKPPPIIPVCTSVMAGMRGINPRGFTLGLYWDTTNWNCNILYAEKRPLLFNRVTVCLLLIWFCPSYLCVRDETDCRFVSPTILQMS